MGASASLTEPIVRFAKDAEWQVDGTLRNMTMLSETSQLFREILFLDISDTNSMKEFIDTVTKRRYSGVIALIGATSGLSLDSSVSEVRKYHEIYSSNYSFLLSQIVWRNVVQGEPGHMLVFGSRASEYGSFDIHYAATKSAVVGICRSLARISNSPSITCLTPN